MNWIKVEHSTPDKPEVYQIAQLCGIEPDAAFGKVLRVWMWFDVNTESGYAPSVTKTIIDRNTGVTGFADAMVKSGWMVEKDGIIMLPNYDRHNGNTAKKRAQSCDRVRKMRAENCSAPSVTNALPDKRREEKSINTTPHTPQPGGCVVARADSLNQGTPNPVRTEVTDEARRAGEAFAACWKSLRGAAMPLTLRPYADLLAQNAIDYGVDADWQVWCLEFVAQHNGARGVPALKDPRTLTPDWFHKVDDAHTRFERESKEGGK